MELLIQQMYQLNYFLKTFEKTFGSTNEEYYIYPNIKLKINEGIT